MFHLARTLLAADEKAEDIVQDVFARLMETDIIPEAEGIRAYLMTAVHHGCTNAIFHLRFDEDLSLKENDQTFIGAILTVIGYSINDKVVVFDRIRSFSFAMILGVIFGTLSSIFIASPIAYLVIGRKIKEEVEVA